MARTFTIKKSGSGIDFTPGWKTLTITKAVYGDYNGTRYLDMWFDGYPESMNARVYEAIGKNNEEFSIAQIFRFSNSGITETLDSPDGDKMVKFEDGTEHLIGNKLNGYFYKDGDYTRILKRFAPTEFANQAETYSERDVNYWKLKAESYYENHVINKVTPPTSNGSTETTTEIPF